MNKDKFTWSNGDVVIVLASGAVIEQPEKQTPKDNAGKDSDRESKRGN